MIDKKKIFTSITYSVLQQEFIDIFLTLSKFMRKCFLYLQWYARKFKCVFPCLIKIANAIGCNPRTVKRCTAYMQSRGWIYKRKRGHQSNLYFMADELIALDLSNSKILERKCPLTVPVFKESFTDLERSSLEEKFSREIDHPIPHCINLQCLDSHQKQRLANNFTVEALTEAVKETRWYHSQGNIIGSFMGYIWNAAKRKSTYLS